MEDAALSTIAPPTTERAAGAADAPIGVFDSGLGGLSVVRELRALMPTEDILYFADSAYCPYGTRPPAEITARCLAIGDELLAQGVKAIVLACNTACAVALTDLRARLDVPIVGVEPAVKPATRLTRTQRVAVLATPRTVASERLARLIQNFAADVEVATVAAPGLVKLVEAGDVRGPNVRRALRQLLEPLLAWEVDVVVLGCTHYPFLRGEIERLVGPEVRVVDSGEAIARRTRAVLEERGMSRNPAGLAGSLRVQTSGDADHVGRIASKLLDHDVATAALWV
ncbi:MAG TPA: glutamate racemase [Thermomicrobiales bacterium]